MVVSGIGPLQGTGEIEGAGSYGNFEFETSCGCSSCYSRREIVVGGAKVRVPLSKNGSYSLIGATGFAADDHVEGDEANLSNNRRIIRPALRFGKAFYPNEIEQFDLEFGFAPLIPVAGDLSNFDDEKPDKILPMPSLRFAYSQKKLFTFVHAIADQEIAFFPTFRFGIGGNFNNHQVAGSMGLADPAYLNLSTIGFLGFQYKYWVKSKFGLGFDFGKAGISNKDYFPNYFASATIGYRWCERHE